MPDVSVVMPVYNTLEYLGEAVQSVLAQEGVDFELIAVDDCATDGSAECLAEFARRDLRVRHLRLEKNGGMANAMNRGVAEARAPLIAQMDSDDIMLPGRLATQKRAMDQNPDIHCMGAAALIVNSHGRYVSSDFANVPTNPALIAWLMPFGNRLANPTMISRTAVLREHPYSLESEFRWCIDYELWCRLGTRYLFSNVKALCLHYRYHERQGSKQYRDSQEAAAMLARQPRFDALAGRAVAPDDVKALCRAEHFVDPITFDDLCRRSELLIDMFVAFLEGWRRPGSVDSLLHDYLARLQRMALGAALGSDVQQVSRVQCDYWRRGVVAAAEWAQRLRRNEG
jgi:glycosyltransferase involved in cell wall biosynthesis